MAKELSHFDESGAARMVDVGSKEITQRVARASGVVRMSAETLKLIRDRKLAKGDVLEVARLAGIMAAKRTAELIPLCHTLPLESVSIEFSFPEMQPHEDSRAPSPCPLTGGEGSAAICIETTVQCTGKTGVEMEALTAVSIAALTIYDMCKSAERGIVIDSIRLEEKAGGKSGNWKAEGKAEGRRQKAE
jgi:cyclic pyranopterin monophosphate synthase